ncbi:carbon-nitrogen family hydrolase [Lentibacillus sp. Marseille-P4043]|uniref:carbon-nitrogen family hydrolase n=1 Tax=Lentibacillus sp. Marseille-P4043 TaxID=2040293 RepID=UPI000D0BA88D|nr:carbon-nitrogen family hydrolase [Lentibacillus sp. Marseille-P4043]
MKYAIYQMEVVAGNPEANRQQVEEWVKRVVKQEQPDTILLPEMWNTGYALSELANIADQDGEPTRSFLRELAKTYNINIVGGSIGNKKDDKFYNTSLVFDRNGELVYHYDKIHLVPMLNEHQYLTGGQKKVHTFELDHVKMGLIICYDLRFPELARQLALEDAQVLHIVAEWPIARKDHWKNLQLARAIENQFFVISSNTVGTYNGTEYAGESMVIDPWGTPIATGSVRNTETITATLDLSIVPKVRKDVPIFSSRVPEMYDLS